MLFVLLAGCSRHVVTGQDELGCERPPGLVAGTSIQIKAFTDFLPGFVSGGLSVEANPAILDTIGAAARGNLADEYIICRARNQGFVTEKAEVEYLRTKLIFMRTDPIPTPGQYIAWEHEHAPPQPNLAVSPTTVHFSGNPNVPITITNFGDAQLLYWLENFPEFPEGPFFMSEENKRGTLRAGTNKTMDVVISMRHGVKLRDSYNFDLRSNIRNGQRFPVTIRVQKDLYPE